MKNLYEDPLQSVAKMGADLRAMGSALSDVSSALYNFTPLAKDIDTTLDYMGYHPEQIHNADGTTPPTTYTDQRALKKQQTIEHIIKTTNDFVEYVKKSSVRSFTSDTSELVSTMVFDTYLTNKAFESVSYLTNKVGNSLVLAGNDMSSLLPPELAE